MQVMVSAIRAGRPCELVITNFRKASPHRFRNGLSLHPLHDSNGKYRFVVGVASDITGTSDQQAALALIRRLLPPAFPAELEPLPPKDGVPSSSGAANTLTEKRFLDVLGEFYRLVRLALPHIRVQPASETATCSPLSRFVAPEQPRAPRAQLLSATISYC